MLRCLGWPVVAGLAAAMLVVTLLPAATALTTGVLVHRVVGIIDSHAALATATVPLVVVGVFLVLDLVSQSLLVPIRNWAGVRVSGSVRFKVRTAVSAPGGVEHLDDQQVRNLAALPVYEIGSLHNIGSAADGQLWLIARFIGAGVSGLLIATYSVPLAVVAFALVTTQRALLRRQFMAMTSDMPVLNQLNRANEYWGSVAGSPVGAKEVRLFGFRHWIVEEFAAVKQGMVEMRDRNFRHALPRQWYVFVLSTLAAGVPFYFLTRGALDHQLSASQLAVALGGVVGVFQIGAMGFEAFAIEAATRQLDALDQLSRIDRPRATAHPAAPTEGPSATVPTVEFENVSFAYPGHSAPVLEGLALTVLPGERLAVVGENGAGKTTLIKLLAGFYRPTGGRVLVDGIDLAERDLREWRRQLAVIFQDFTHFELSAYDNVALAHASTVAQDPTAATAAGVAGAMDVIEGLPQGWETMLSRAYSGGTELSGGEWQKIALARALYAALRGARVLILDEPTANLDVNAETALFDQLLEHAAGLTSIVISHRFSTVRRANRIVVLDSGRIIEDGSHEDLMRQQGMYARLYTLQASRYTTESAGPEGSV
jgi:ATP-binding cassette subfamily B protein